MREFHQVEIPPRLAARPRDARGYPIPYTVVRAADGKPDFRITDMAVWAQAVKLRACALCAQPLGRHLVFVGGPMSEKTRLFTDLPMHRDCAEYALRVCPFLAAPNFRYAENLRSAPQDHVLSVNDAVSAERPELFFLGVTRGYRLIRNGDAGLLAQAEPWAEVVWWRQGERLALPLSSVEVDASSLARFG